MSRKRVMRMPGRPHSRRRTLLGAAIIVLVGIVSTYVGIVIVAEGVGSAVLPILLAILLGVSLIRLWAWSTGDANAHDE